MHLPGGLYGGGMETLMDKDKFSQRETERRRDEALKRMLSTPPVKHTDQKPSSKKTASVRRKKLID
jgi:hypothetical protein